MDRSPTDSICSSVFKHSWREIWFEQAHSPIGRSLPKTGIFQISAGDYRLFRVGNGQIRSLETGCQFAKARHWRAFLRLLRVKSPGAGLVGWRRSADRTRLRANSLVSGNFTGNFAILGLRDTITCQETAALQPLLEQFPTQIISENILGNSEF
jgi:hypothetical protein